MSADSISLARASFERCLLAADFFPTFYRNLFRRSPTAEPHFAHTDMERQHKLLRHAIGLLFVFPSQRAGDVNVLSRVAHRHGKDDLRIPADEYPAFVDALVETAAQYDPQFGPAIEAAWRAAVAPGIAYMQSKA